MSEKLKLSYSIGEGRNQIEFFGSDDVLNSRGTNRISLNPRRFGKGGIQEVIKHELESATPRTHHILNEDRTRLVVESAEFKKVKTGTTRGRSEFTVFVSQTIANASAWTIEEGIPADDTLVNV